MNIVISAVSAMYPPPSRPRALKREIQQYPLVQEFRLYQWGVVEEVV